MVEISWTRQAISDIDNIARFIAKDSERYAKIQTRRFFELVMVLQKSPKVGRIVPELNIKNIRELISGNYRIIYKILSATKVDIIAIHHSARLLKKKSF